MKKMKAVVINGEREVEVRELNKPEVTEGKVLVNLQACALCTWEQRMYTGEAKMQFPFIPGHEAAGLIEAVGPNTDTDLTPGDRVVVKFLNQCNQCYYCRTGNDNQCVRIYSRNTIDGINASGGLSQYVLVDPASIFKLTADIPMSHAAFTEPLGCVVRSIERGEIELGDDVVVVGAGIMGLLHVMLAKRSGARVIVSEPDQARRQKAIELGADEVINPLAGDPVARVKELTEGRGGDVVFHTTAIPEIAAQAIKMTGKLGKVIFYGSFHPNKPIEIDPNQIHYDEIMITGTVSPTSSTYRKAAKLLSTGIIDPTPLISGQYGLKDIEEAFQQAIRKDTFRIIVNLE